MPDCDNNNRHTIQCGHHRLDLSRPQVMGVLNVTPDSFSDGGRFVQPEKAIAQALQMQSEGAGIIDVGGESTRPGAQPVSVDQELARVLPVVESIAPELAVPVSVDTSKPEVMQAAVAAGAGMINDVMALRAEGAIEVLANSNVAVCLMHMQGEPRTMQAAPSYNDVVTDVSDFLGTRLAACEAGGIERGRVVLDPGFGFGKSLDHNLTLLARLAELKKLNCPLLVGLSRKSMFKMLLDADMPQRLPGSLAAALIAIQGGARIIRAHDVWQTLHVIRTWQATQEHRV